MPTAALTSKPGVGISAASEGVPPAMPYSGNCQNIPSCLRDVRASRRRFYPRLSAQAAPGPRESPDLWPVRLALRRHDPLSEGQAVYHASFRRG
jgi:hypothetical protein